MNFKEILHVCRVWATLTGETHILKSFVNKIFWCRVQGQIQLDVCFYKKSFIGTPKKKGEAFASLLYFSYLPDLNRFHKCLNTFYFKICCLSLRNMKLLCKILCDHSASFTFPNLTRMLGSFTPKMSFICHYGIIFTNSSQITHVVSFLCEMYIKIY